MKDDPIKKLPSGLVLVDFQNIQPKSKEQADFEHKMFFGETPEETNARTERAMSIRRSLKS
jgi:hypothetical protein